MIKYLKCLLRNYNFLWNRFVTYITWVLNEMWIFIDQQRLLKGFSSGLFILFHSENFWTTGTNTLPEMALGSVFESFPFLVYFGLLKSVSIFLLTFKGLFSKSEFWIYFDFWLSEILLSCFFYFPFDMSYWLCLLVHVGSNQPGLR